MRVKISLLTLPPRVNKPRDDRNRIPRLSLWLDALALIRRKQVTVRSAAFPSVFVREYMWGFHFLFNQQRNDKQQEMTCQSQTGGQREEARRQNLHKAISPLHDASSSLMRRTEGRGCSEGPTTGSRRVYAGVCTRPVDTSPR